MATAFIGLGSNIGDREAQLRAALQAVAELPGTSVACVSGFYETEPQGGPPQPDYLNAVARVETSLAPEELLGALLDIERRLGRVRSERWGPRVIDLDILLYDGRVIDGPDLKVPHPRMHERRFVLEPLAEIAPDALHPLLRKTVRQLLGECP